MFVFTKKTKIKLLRKKLIYINKLTINIALNIN